MIKSAGSEIATGSERRQSEETRRRGATRVPEGERPRTWRRSSSGLALYPAVLRYELLEFDHHATGYLFDGAMLSKRSRKGPESTPKPTLAGLPPSVRLAAKTELGV
jgi:hypothetical protein